MEKLDIVQQRLYNQGLIKSNFKKPREIVEWLGAVQAQDYPNAKWAIGLRLPNSFDSDIEEAISKGEIIRTHILRPTWHFVSPKDIRWMLALTAPRVKAICTPYCRKMGLTEETLLKSRSVIKKSLIGGKQLSRSELRINLEKSGINTKELRFVFILMLSELDGLICSGARIGKKFSYALLDEVAPKTRAVSHEEALTELVRRYFTSHGPATINDFVWWSGLKISDAKKGLEKIKKSFKSEEIDGKKYFFKGDYKKDLISSFHLLPNYDEYFSYKDRSAYLYNGGTLSRTSGFLNRHIILMNGKIIGGWKNQIKEKEVIIQLNLFIKLSVSERKRLSHEFERYAKFVGMPVRVV